MYLILDLPAGPAIPFPGSLPTPELPLKLSLSTLEQFMRLTIARALPKSVARRTGCNYKGNQVDAMEGQGEISEEDGRVWPHSTTTADFQPPAARPGQPRLHDLLTTCESRTSVPAFAESAAVVARVFAAAAAFAVGAAARPVAFASHSLSAARAAGAPVPVSAAGSVALGSASAPASPAAADISGLSWYCPCWEGRGAGPAEVPSDGTHCCVKQHWAPSG